MAEATTETPAKSVETPAPKTPAPPPPSTVYRGDEVASGALVSAAQKVAEGVTGTGRLLVTTDPSLATSFALARQIAAAIDAQKARADAVLAMSTSAAELAPPSHSEVGVRTVIEGGAVVETATAVAEAAGAIWAKLLETLVPTVSATVDARDVTGFETIALVMGALKGWTVVVDDGQIPGTDAPPLAQLAALREMVPQLEAARREQVALLALARAQDPVDAAAVAGLEARRAALAAEIETLTAFLDAVLKPAAGADRSPLVVALTRLGLVVDAVLVLAPARVSIQQTSLHRVASTPRYVVDAFARIPYLMVSGTSGGGTPSTGGVATGSDRRLATFDTAAGIAPWVAVDAGPRRSMLPVWLQLAAATVPTILFVVGFVLPLTVVRFPGVDASGVWTFRAETLAPDALEVVLLLAPAVAAMGALAFRDSERYLPTSFVAAVVALAATVLQFIVLMRSHLVFEIGGGVVPFVLLAAAVAHLWRRTRRGSTAG